MEQTLNKSQHTKLTLEKKILPPLLPGFKLTTLQSQVWHSYQQTILVPHDDDDDDENVSTENSMHSVLVAHDWGFNIHSSNSKWSSHKISVLNLHPYTMPTNSSPTPNPSIPSSPHTSHLSDQMSLGDTSGRVMHSHGHGAPGC